MKRFLSRVRKPQVEDDGPMLLASPPAFVALTAALTYRLRVLTVCAAVGGAVLVLVIIVQQRIILDKLFEEGREKVVIVPGAPEFIRVRPDQVPDEAVHLFAEYVAGQMGSFSHRDVRYQFGKLEKYMSREMAGRFNRDFEDQVKIWEARQLEQSFALEPVRTFYLRNDGSGPAYHAFVKGTTTRYLSGKSFSQTAQVLYLSFRTRAAFTTERPFIFELENLRWMDTPAAEALESQMRTLEETR